jgi:hypothetical protein
MVITAPVPDQVGNGNYHPVPVNYRSLIPQTLKNVMEF